VDGSGAAPLTRVNAPEEPISFVTGSCSVIATNPFPVISKAGIPPAAEKTTSPVKNEPSAFRPPINPGSSALVISKLRLEDE
jgi:hypothetical protein